MFNFQVKLEFQAFSISSGSPEASSQISIILSECNQAKASGFSFFQVLHLANH
jgi:hypothetical protein